jgi:sporulation protein YlmC with PRC-barrel domain
MDRSAASGDDSVFPFPEIGTRGEVRGFLPFREEGLMPARYTAVGAAAAALLATVAFAQTPVVSGRTDMAPSTASDISASTGWRASKLVGLAVYNTNDESLGTISDLLTDRSGHIKAVVIGVGGLLGVGAHLVAVPFDKVRFTDERISYAAAAGSPHASGEATSTTTVGVNAAPSPASKSDSPDHAVFNATKEELKAMPEFTYPT